MRSIRPFTKLFYFPQFGKTKGLVQPIHISSLINYIEDKLNDLEFSEEIFNVCGKTVYEYIYIIKSIINTNCKVRFIRLPLLFTLYITKLFEMLKLPVFISSEEIVSMNLDKVVCH